MSNSQDTPADPTKVVQKGDVLETKAEFLKAVPMTIEWSQKWTTRSENYYYVVFENTTQGKNHIGHSGVQDLLSHYICDLH